MLEYYLNCYNVRIRLAEAEPNNLQRQRKLIPIVNELRHQYAELKNHPEALRYASKLIQLDPKSAVFRYYLATQLRDVGRLAEGIEQMKIAISFAPSDAGQHALLSDMLKKMVSTLKA